MFELDHVKNQHNFFACFFCYFKANNFVQGFVLYKKVGAAAGRDSCWLKHNFGQQIRYDRTTMVSKSRKLSRFTMQSKMAQKTNF
jgi:hypothetical protein